MSEPGNLQTVRAMYEAFGRGDITFITSQCTQDVQWEATTPWNPTPTTVYTGSAGVLRFFQDLTEHTVMTKFKPQDFLVSGDLVVVLGSFTAHPVTTHESFSANWAMAFTLREGKVASFREYADSTAARAAFAKQSTAV